MCRERTVALDRAGRRKADALAARKEIARSRVCLELYLVGQRRREQSVLQDVAGMGIKEQNSQGVDWLEDADRYALHQVPRFDSEAVLTKHGVFWIGGTLQFSGSPRNGGGHFQAEEAERIHTDATE